MRWLSFLSKVALVCNFFFLVTVAMHFYSFLEDKAMISTVIIIGYALAVFIFSPLVNIICFAILLFRRKLFDVVPKWLVLTNFIFFVLQVLYIIFFLNGSIYS